MGENQSAKESGVNPSVPKTIWGAAVELAKRFGIAVVLLIALAWRMDQQNQETREQNKVLIEESLKNTARLATIIEQNTAQSKQTQQAIEKFTESITQQQRSIEKVLDRFERSHSAIHLRGPINPNAPVIE